MPHNVHASIGKRKGKFVSKKYNAKIVKFNERMEGKRGRRLTETMCESEITTREVDFQSIEGCRIVNIEQLSKTMWCTACNMPVSLRHVKHEQQQGLATKWFVECLLCSKIIEVETSKKSNKYRDSNLKLAIGMLDAGIGETKTNTLLSALNIPAVTGTSLRRYERCVGPVIEEVANESCVDAIEKEKKLTVENQLRE